MGKKRNKSKSHKEDRPRNPIGEGDPEDATLSAFQLKDRRERTCFVGNVPLECTPK